MPYIQPPPTYAEVILVDEHSKRARFNPIWLKWFVDLAEILNQSGGTSLNHNDLDNIQGGSASERYHLTVARDAMIGNRRVVAVADGTTFTPTADTADVNTQDNTQATGNLTMAAPTGTPVDGQKIIFEITSVDVQTFVWNAIYRGSVDLALPASSTGSDKTDYMGFIYRSADTKWDLLAKNMGF